MNKLPRQMLCNIVTRYGQSVCDNPQRCEGLLRDFCGQHKREISVLVAALRDGIPGQLQISKNAIPQAILLARLSTRLQNDSGLAAETATWAVESWALALGVISEVATPENNSLNTPQVQTSPQREWRSVMTFTHGAAAVRCLAISSDGQILASGSEDTTIRLWHLGSGGLVRTLPWKGAFGESQASWVTSLTMSPNGQTVASSNLSKFVKLWDCNSGQLLRNFRGHSDTVHTVAFSADGTTLVSGSRDNSIKVRNLLTEMTSEKVSTFREHSNSVLTVALSPDGQTLVSGSRDHTITLWDLPHKKLLHKLRDHSDQVLTVAASPRGNVFVSGSSDQTIKLWSLDTGALLRTFKGHSDWVNAVAIGPDGGTLVSGSKDATLRLWDLRSGQIVSTLADHQAAICSVVVSLDGDAIASSSEDGIIKIWRKT